MIVELVGLPGSGKTTLANKLVARGGWTRVTINHGGELVFYNLFFFFRHPILFLKGFSWLILYRGQRALWYTKFMNLFLVHNAKYMKAGKYARAIIDQGHHQNIISLFDTRVNETTIDRYIDVLPKPDLLCFFLADDELRTKRLAERGYGVRGELNEDYREAWEEARATHFEHLYLSRRTLPCATETVTPEHEDHIILNMSTTRRWYLMLHGRMPTEKAHGLQIAKTLEALKKTGAAPSLWIPRGTKNAQDEIAEYYSLSETFPVRSFGTPDFLKLPQVLGQLRFWFDALFFFFALASTRLDLTGVYYTRNPELAWLFKLKGAQVWYEAHTVPSSKIFLFKFFLEHVDGIIANSNGTKNALVRQGLHHVHVVRNGVDIERFADLPEKADTRALLGLPSTKKIIMYVGAFYEWKGVPFLLETWVKYFSLREDLLLVLVGGSPNDLTHEGVREQLLRMSNITFVPHTLAEKIPLYLSTADILVLPNVPISEESTHYTSPIKLFEYLASGCPIVAADLPSIRELLSSETASLFTAGDSGALAIEIDTTLRFPDDAMTRGARARTEANKYSWMKRAEHLLLIVGEGAPSAVSAHVQFLKTLVMGVFLGVCYLLLVYFFTAYVHLWYALSVGVAYTVIFATQFLLLKAIFVGGARPVAYEISRFALLSIANFVANEIVTYILVEWLNVWYMLAQLLIVGVLAVINFFVYRSTVFEREP